MNKVLGTNHAQKIGNITLTKLLVIISSTPLDKLFSILDDINGSNTEGRKFRAVPASLLTTTEIITTPTVHCSGYVSNNKSHSLPLPPHINTQVHYPQTPKPTPHIPKNKADDDAKPKTHNRHAQVNLQAKPYNLIKFTYLSSNRVLFGEHPPYPQRSWAELLPGGSSPEGIPHDLSRLCDGQNIRLILLHKPFEGADDHPMSHTWELPDETRVLLVFSSAILNLHRGDIGKASKTLSYLIKNCDLDTCSIWITPKDWTTFDYFRIFIRALTLDNMCYETFPAQGLVMDNPQPVYENLFRYATYVHPSPRSDDWPVYRAARCYSSKVKSIFNINHYFLPIQAFHPQVQDPNGTPCYQDNHPGVHLCRIRLRLILILKFSANYTPFNPSYRLLLFNLLLTLNSRVVVIPAHGTTSKPSLLLLAMTVRSAYPRISRSAIENKILTSAQRQHGLCPRGTATILGATSYPRRPSTLQQPPPTQPRQHKCEHPTSLNQKKARQSLRG